MGDRVSALAIAVSGAALVVVLIAPRSTKVKGAVNPDIERIANLALGEGNALESDRRDLDGIAARSEVLAEAGLPTGQGDAELRRKIDAFAQRELMRLWPDFQRELAKIRKYRKDRD